MNKFLAMSVFVRVVEAGGFTAAARRLGMSVSAVTKAVARLEEELDLQLFNRTTRRLSTTDLGQEFYEHSTRILADLEEAELSVQRSNLAMKGRIKVLVPQSFGRVTLVPALPSFFERYPDITLEIDFRDSHRGIDLIADGYDLAVRTGKITDSRLVTRILTRSPQITVAAPSYLARHGEPRTPEELVRHNCILGSLVGSEWVFTGSDGAPVSVRVRGNAFVNGGDALREAAVTGLGIVQGTWWLMRKDIERGDVKAILTDYVSEGAPISVLYPANRHRPTKVRAFIDFLIAITQPSSRFENSAVPEPEE